MEENTTGNNGAKVSGNIFNSFLQRIENYFALEIIAVVLFVIVSISGITSLIGSGIQINNIFIGITSLSLIIYSVFIKKVKSSNLSLILLLCLFIDLIIGLNGNKLVGISFILYPFLLAELLSKKNTIIMSLILIILYLFLSYMYLNDIATIKIATISYLIILFISVQRNTNTKDVKNKLIDENVILWENLVNSLPDMIYLKSSDNTFKKLNYAFAHFFHVEDVSTVIGENEKNVFQNEVAELLFNDDSEILSTNEAVWDKICTIHNNDDGLYYFSCTKVPIKNENNETIGLIGIIRDISEQVEIENEVSRYIEELQVNRDQSEEVAGQLAYLNVKLTESEEKLKELNANKDKFFSIISHDLKSPFTSLLGFSDFLLNDIDEMEKDEIKEFVQNINSSAKGVFKLLQNLLEWSRLQTDRIEFFPGLFDIGILINDLKDIYVANLIQKSIKLEITLDNDLKVYADKNMIETVIRNLLSNAIKFTPNGKKIHITAKRNDEFVYVSVRDEGVGISESNMKKLFRIDEHLTTDGTNAEKGTGLGLILCKEFVNKNGGEIQVSSEINNGTEFKFNLQIKNIFNN
ncbi:MAG: PAS domain-containing protein [Ignavibacteria bacterium]|nr:PAS domain-containing protein [Ignavibacteria bacterium]